MSEYEAGWEAAKAFYRDTLSEIRELICDYVDIRDGYSGPLPNNAMRAQQLIDEVLR